MIDGTDLLAERIDNLTIAIPAAPRLQSSALRSRPHVPLRVAFGGAAAAALILVVTAAGYPGVLDTLSQDVLHIAGLSRTQVTALEGTGANPYLSATVSGGYGDQLSTVLFVSINPKCQPAAHPATADPCILGAPYLTDQYGYRYDIIGGEGIGGGTYPIWFEPLRDGTASGAHLTLHVPQGETELVIPISGSLRAERAYVDATQPSISANGVTYQLRQVVHSKAYLEVHTLLSGQLQNVIVRRPSSGTCQAPAGGACAVLTGQEWPGVFVVDSNGKWLIPLAELRPNVSTSLQDETRIFSINKPGTYRIVVATNPNQNVAPGPAYSVLAAWTVTIR